MGGGEAHLAEGSNGGGWPDMEYIGEGSWPSG